MIKVINSGFYTTIQDYPGRIGYWDVGIPPSGPMDSLAFRLANRLVGNNDSDAGLEMTAVGVTLKFLCDAVIAITGAELRGTMNGQKVPWWKALFVEGGSILSLGSLMGPGCRSYMAIQGGIDVPDYLGSKSTFPKGGFGGYEGRPLKKDDLICLKEVAPCFRDGKQLEVNSIPKYEEKWEVGAILGPHCDPDFFTSEDVVMFYNTPWRVHHNSNRLGYRLEGPRPKFARRDGGEGGSHPSNLIDYPYAIGTVNFTGDMPIILTVDGPSLGGFVSMATVASSELWKIGQAKPHDFICFKKMTVEEAIEDLTKQEKFLEEIPPIL